MIINGSLNKLSLIKNGSYLSVSLYLHKKPKVHYVHRLVAQAFILNLEDKPCVNHKDGNKLNNVVSNLEWCTHEENTQYFFTVQKPQGLYDKSICKPNPKCKEQRNEYGRTYYLKNKLKRKKYNKLYYLKNREIILSKKRERRMKNDSIKYE